MMGFPEPIAHAQRDAMRGDLQRVLDVLDGTIFGLREISPHNVALTRGEYDRVKEYLVGAKISISNAIDAIDESLTRQAHEQQSDELAAAEKEVEGGEV
jgi:hypothetical protein